MKHVIEYDCKCGSCGATGLYVGMAERDGAAVVCHSCRGSGKRHIVIEYEDFEGRVPRENVERVLETNPGVIVGKGGTKYTLEQFGGLAYTAWSEGKPFPPKSEMREFTCPRWWYQSADHKRAPDWKECWDTLGRTFSQCPHFADKAGCWARFDRETSNDGAQK